MTIEELGKHLHKNKVSSEEIFNLIDNLNYNGIPSLSWRYENKIKSLEILTDLVNLMKLKI